MLVQASQGQSGSAHVVVLGNEKGGSGKSTTALHIAVALMKAGQRVATIDLDCRQQSFTRYINNRRAWARRTGLDLEIPVHYCIKHGETMQIATTKPPNSSNSWKRSARWSAASISSSLIPRAPTAT
jgi:chromosome partitioning protein